MYSNDRIQKMNTANYVTLAKHYFILTKVSNRKLVPSSHEQPISVWITLQKHTRFQKNGKNPPDIVSSGYFIWRREWDSNPRRVAASLVFKTSSLNHSDISPKNACSTKCKTGKWRSERDLNPRALFRRLLP